MESKSIFRKKKHIINWAFLILISALVIVSIFQINEFRSAKLFLKYEAEWKNNIVLNIREEPFIVYFYSDYCNKCKKEIEEMYSFQTDELQIFGIKPDSGKRKLNIPYLLNGKYETFLFGIFGGRIGKLILVGKNGNIILEKERDITFKEFYLKCLDEAKTL